MNERRRLSRSDLDLWRRATADVKPLAATPVSDETPLGAKRQAQRDDGQPPNGHGAGHVMPAAAKDLAKPPAPRGPKALDPARPVDIDRRSWERLKRGQIAIERKLDLHGRTQSEAHRALDRFLAMAAATGLRCVLVVTGKGGAAGRGVLRQMVPRWLAEAGNRDKVLTYCPAQPRHGGDGALYVLLKRRKGDRP